MNSKIKKLNDEQVEAFNTEYFTLEMWQSIENALLSLNFNKNDSLEIMDIGGGNGIFCDRFLERFPMSTATNLDNSEILLKSNKKNSRKKLINMSVTEIDKIDNRFDILFFNWALHHFVRGTYLKTVKQQQSIMENVKKLLKLTGLIVILEDVLVPLCMGELPSYIIYNLTSSNLIKPFAKLAGANTAGIGVCFHTDWRWKNMFIDTGYTLLWEKWFFPIHEDSKKKKFIMACMGLKSMWYKAYILQIK